ncbi:IS66 family insertion sequence hypothetical protein [Methylobacterium sp. V23]|nr:IS66 family insertion sequence hypothetical protein [Methylobacterium sp. V23]
MLEPFRRLELFTGAGRRRSWSADEKAAIVSENEATRVSIRAVALRRGLSASQLFTWRRQARCALVSCSLEDGVRFVPALLTLEPRQPMSDKTEVSARREPAPCTGIEVELAGARARIGPVLTACTPS